MFEHTEYYEGRQLVRFILKGIFKELTKRLNCHVTQDMNFKLYLSDIETGNASSLNLDEGIPPERTGKQGTPPHPMEGNFKS